MRKLLLQLSFLVFGLGSSVCLVAQPTIQWERTFGGSSNDYLSAVVQTPDGGYLVGGTSNSNKSGDKSENTEQFISPWIVKVDANGVKQWDRTVPVYADLHSILLTEDGGYLLGGENEGSELLVKLDNAGKVEWEKSINGGEGIVLFGAMEKTPDGGYIVGFSSAQAAGGAKSQEPIGSLDYWVVKLDADGNILWDKQYGGTKYDGLKSIQVASDGGYLIAGYSYSGISGNKTQESRGDSDLWIIKLDASGNLQWEKTIGGTGTEYGPRISVTTDGGYILGARSSSKASGEKTQDSNGNDYWIIKLSDVGQIQWQRSLSGGYTQEYFDDDFRTLIQTADGGYLAGGHTSSPAGNDKTSDGNGLKPDMWIVKLAANGTTQWDKTIGSAGSDFLLDLIQTTDGGYFLGGHSDSNASGDKTQNSRGVSDYWVVKLAPENAQTKTPIRINAGGPDFTTATKKLFIADKYYAGIDRTSSIASGDILNTSNDVFYRSGRCSPSFSYNIPIENGNVEVILHFAEIYYGAPGKKGGKGSRQFHVNMEGSRKLTNFDIFAAAGGAMRAYQQTFPVTVTDGVLNIDFLTGAADLPRVSAIEVLPSQQQVRTFTPEADATVRGGIYKDQNFGSDQLLGVKGGNGNLNRKTYLRFRVPAVANVKSATLRIYANNHESVSGAPIGTGGVLNDAWTENGITFSNAPSHLNPALESRTSVRGELKYYDMDVTDFVRSQVAGDKVVSLAIVTAYNNNLINIHSKENTSGFAPQLIITTSAPSAAARIAMENESPEIVVAPASTIYPNPAKDHIMLEVSSGHKSNIDLKLTNMIGSQFQLQRTGAEGSSSRLKVGLPDKLQAGMYLLKVQSNEFSEVFKVLVKE
ncbi:hypothetical protein GCM10011325_36960 [Dyadobacter sediminis]|nr:hypothetical protein GCM10011325_36960 [Dyadobacter sediminis]